MDNDLQKQINEIREHLKDVPTRNELKDVVREAIADSLLSAGKWAKIAIVTLATIVASIAIITGGLKWILGLFGFFIIKN